MSDNALTGWGIELSGEHFWLMRLGRWRSLWHPVIPTSGRVEVQVSLRRSRFENHVATLSFRLPSTRREREARGGPGEASSGEPVELAVGSLVAEPDVVEA